MFSTSVGTPYAPGPGFRFAGGPGPAGVPYSPGEIRTPAMESAEANDWSREELAAYAAAYGWTQLPAMSGWGRPGEDAEMREVYREMLRDESVKAAVLQKILGVSSLGLSFVLPKGWEGNPQAARINEFVGYNFEEHLHSGWPQTAWSLLSGMLQEGHVLGEPVMEKAPIRGGPWDGKRPLAKIKSKDPRTYDLILDPFLNLHAVRSRMNLHVVRPAERYLVLSHLPVYENPLGTSDLRSAYRAFVCKDAALKLRQLFLDKYAGPFLYATVTDNAFKAELAKDLKKARAAGYIVLPPGTTLQVLNLATASDAAFKSAIDDYDRAILIGILGSYLHVLEGQTRDGRGDTKVHRGVAELFQWFLAETLANAITRQVVPKIVHENFWLPCYPRAVLEAVDPNQIKSELMIGTMLRNAGVATSLGMWYEKSRWARPASKGDTLEGKPLNTPGGGPFGSGGGGEAFSDDEPDEPPPGPAPADSLVAGPDGERAGELLSKVIADGSRRLADAAAPAVRRLMDHPLRGRYQARLFSDEELHRVAGVIAESMAHGDLLGRAAVRDRWRQEESGGHVHCDQPAGLRAFADAVEPAGGIREALAYFRGLEPSLSAEPDRFGPPLLRRAFTLAQDADRVVLKRVQNSIAKAIEGGLPVDEVARSVDEILDDAGVGPRRRGYSELVVRTNTADAYTAGVEAERNDPEVRDAFPAWYYAAVIDGRERPTHGARHGMLFPREVAFNEVRGVDAKDVCQCVLPRQLVQGRVRAASKAWYSGEAVEVRTSRGQCVSLTVNHPVLTPQGFVRAGDLDKGDDLACHRQRGEVFRVRHEYVEQRPALIENVFGTLKALGPVGIKESTVVDFYSDGRFLHGEVEVVRADGFLRNCRYAEALKGSNDFSLAEPYFLEGAFAIRRSQGLGHFGINPAAGGFVGGPHLGFSSIGVGDLGPLQQFGFTPAANVDAGFQENAADRGPGDAMPIRERQLGFSGFVGEGDTLDVQPQLTDLICFGPAAEMDTRCGEPVGKDFPTYSALFGELVRSFPSKVATDQITEIRRFHYDGPVYDLETDVGYFSVGGQSESIILKNCRCVPVVVTRRELARLRAGGREFSDPRMVVHSEHAHAGWDETEHPRDKGRFAPKAGGVASTIPPGQFPAAIDLEDMAGELGFRNAGQWLDAATGFGRAASEPGGDRLVHRAEEYGQKNYTISSKLRSGRPLTPDEHEQVKAVDELARRGGLPVAMELHRVVGEGFPDLKPGDVYRDPAPASTSYDPEVTKNIAVRGRRRDLVIEAPAGSPALYTPAGERGEIVLPSGSALKVVSAEGGTIRARLEPPADESQPGVTRHAEGGRRRLFAHAGWDASKHRRGQPGNKGQFVGPGGSGGGVGSGGGSPGRGPGAGMVSVREAIDRHDGDIGEASAELRSKISDYMRAGGKVSLWYDGKEVPVAKVEGGAVYDAKGQRWGMMPLAMGIKGTKTGIEFKAPEEHPAVAKAKDFAGAKAAEHADAVARVLGVKSQAARAKLHEAILAAARHSIANGSGSVTIRGPNGRTVRVTVRYKGKPHSEGGEDFELEIEEVRGGAHADRPFAHAGYDPGKHPRGQPGNRGEFGPGGGISGAVSAVTERAKANVRAAVGHLPESVRGPLGNAYHAVHASLMAVNRSARTLARRVAEERGGSPEHVERLSRVLAAADLIVPGAVGLAVASTGAVAAGKLASYVPVGSMSYVLYSAARNPAAVLRAAGRAIQRDFPEAAEGAWRFALGAARHPLTPAATVHAASPAGVGLIDDYLRHFAPQGEFAEAALLAALDETRDVAAAVRMASQVASQRSYAGTDPSKHPHKPKGKGGGQFAKKGDAGGGVGGPDEGRPSRPENRHPGASPKVYPWRPPPPKLARAKGVGRPERPKGDESQTKLGDQSEALAKELGFRNIIPEGRRAHRPGEVAEKGSTIDVEFDHSGRAYEIKMCRVESTEYRLKAKASEKEAKLKFAELNKLEPYTMVAVRDGPRGEVHFYGSREPGLIGAEVSEKYFDYLGTVRIA